MKRLVHALVCLCASAAPLSSIAQQEAPKVTPDAAVPQASGATSVPASTPPPPAPQPAGPQAATQPGTQPQSSNRYVVGPEDAIQVSVWQQPSFSGSFPVRPDGMISLALVGDIVAAGRTPMDLANDLTERLRKFIVDPAVTVTVLAVNSKRVFLIGEIAKTGPIPLTSDLSPLQAIASAGGLTPYANRKHIYILRGEQGKQKKIPFNYNKAVKDGNSQGVTLLPGDTIVVP
jgi:polysaccharide export outer membrane protein